VDFHHAVRGLPYPAVDLEDLGRQGEGLTGDALARQAAAEISGRRVIGCFQGRTDRRHEHRRPQRPDRLAGQDVGLTAPRVGQADRDINRDDLQWPARGSLFDEAADLSRRVGADRPFRQGDTDPP
jgi:hypothetical protein